MTLNKRKGDWHMRLASFVITAVVVGLSGPAFAQGGSGQQTAANPPAGQTTTAQALNPMSSTGRNWVASGYIGNNFGINRDPIVDLSAIENLDNNSSTSANFGGQIAYLGRGVVGGEFLMDFSPNLSTFDNLLFAEDPDVNTYMFNLIAVAPFGKSHGYDPYFSGGIGSVSLNATVYSVVPVATPFADPNAIAAIPTQTVSGNKFGWNLGGGFMAFSERNWGFRGDVRYYATNVNSEDLDGFNVDEIGDGDAFSRVALSGISFWKVNAGLAFRW
jgi:hypothetical protein